MSLAAYYNKAILSKKESTKIINFYKSQFKQTQTKKQDVISYTFFLLKKYNW